MNRADDDACEDWMYALGQLDEERAARVAQRLSGAGWEALERRIAAETQLRDQLGAAAPQLREDAVRLLAHLQALRDRLRALQGTAAAAARLGTQAAKGGTQ